MKGIKSIVTYIQASPPADPIRGQTWFNIIMKELLWWNGSIWQPVYTDRTNSGYICGGHHSTTSVFVDEVDKLYFPIDSGTGIVTSRIDTNLSSAAGFNSAEKGFICGGQLNSGGSLTNVIRILTFPFDQQEFIQVGICNRNRRFGWGCNSSLHGFVMGGEYALGSGTYVCEKLEFPYDSGTSTDVSNLNNYPIRVRSGCNSSIHGFIHGSYTTANVDSESVLFPFDSANFTVEATMVNSRYNHCGFNSSVDACAIGGYRITAYTSMDKLDFATLSGYVSSTVLSTSRYSSSGLNSSLNGFCCGGLDGAGTAIKDVAKVVFANPWATAFDLAELSLAREKGTGIDSTDFVSMFV